jgi:ribosomal protein L11 methyltransferase
VLRLAIRVARADAERALAELIELTGGGLEEVDRGELVEYAIYGAPGELPALPDLRAAVGGALAEVSTSEVADDWDQRWKGFHRPLVLGERLAVRAPWHAPAGAQLELVIDPGQAFGTGAHATTRLCLELLLDLPAGGALADVGCGSGVLAIAAARLGFAPVAATDFDPLSVAATRANAQINGAVVDVRRADLRSDPLPVADTVLANLLAPLLRVLCERIGEPPRRLVASGLLMGEADEIATLFAARGLREARRLEREGWAALLLERAHDGPRPR